MYQHRYNSCSYTPCPNPLQLLSRLRTEHSALLVIKWLPKTEVSFFYCIFIKIHKFSNIWAVLIAILVCVYVSSVIVHHLYMSIQCWLHRIMYRMTQISKHMQSLNHDHQLNGPLMSGRQLRCPEDMTSLVPLQYDFYTTNMCLENESGMGEGVKSRKFVGG